MSAAAELYADKRTGYFSNARTDIQPVIPESAASVLEIGCGGGGTLRWLRGIRTVGHAMGIELVDDAAHEARDVFDEVVVGNIETMDLDLPPDRFDLILMLDVLEHLVDPWQVVARCHKALKPGGAMVVSIPNVAHYSVALPLLFRGRWTYADEGLLDRTHLRFFVERTAIDLMTSSGLVFEAISRNTLLPRRLGRRLRWYAKKIIDRLPGHRLFDSQFVIRVRKPAVAPI
jgi:SAM-dependent methyltransferase